ncbi:primosome assembly protein PriA [Ornithinimicrobium flavum]|uniref:primosomal protein N' family DNA-binding protein n=1 Tax=Ornithinimicrobium flavum TaxID=1288636 RepID=UPI0010705167|nr:primosome assembly protein PriA [Ornithinimicrobium flavum]
MSEQLALVPEPEGVRRRPASPAADMEVAPEQPVARVLVETPLAHLDRPFDYLVPAELADDARPGARVRVRLAGRDRDGVVLERVGEADHTGRLSPLRTVVSPEPVLSPQVAAEIRRVADHYGGTAADVLRLAVPPRHARAERSVPPRAQERPRQDPGPVGPGPLGVAPAGVAPAGLAPAAAWADYPAGAAFLRRVASGSSPAASWLALPGRPPGRDWPDAVAQAVGAAVGAGRGALVVVPDHRDVQRVLEPVVAAVGADTVVQLTADLGPEARYTAFLRVLRGHARVVVGTRSASFAPVQDLGLLVCWDEGDDLHQEPRAPYPHVREILRVRAAHERAALLLGGFTRSVVVQGWVREGLVASVAAAPATVRSATPAVTVAGEGWQEARDEGARTARIPTLAWRALKEGLQHGPVLVQVPRQGYVVALACQDCRAPVPCPACGGPTGAPAAGALARCRWCGVAAPVDLPCARCGSRRRRATGVGERRTAEELGRAFPGVLVRTSGGDRVLAEVGPEPSLVVATPGAEPWCRSGYAAVALLDGWRLLERASIDAQAEALRRWCAAAALAASPVGSGRGDGPPVVLCGVPPHAGLPAVEALVRWDPAWLATRELGERTQLGLPPARRYATLTGPPQGVTEAAQELSAAGHDLVGIREDLTDGKGAGGRASATVRESPQAPSSLAAAVHVVRAARSARKARDAVRIALDDVDATA